MTGSPRAVRAPSPRPRPTGCIKALGDGPAPTAAPSDPPADPADIDALLSHIPAAVAAQCTEDRHGHDAHYGGLAQVICTQSSDGSVLFTLYNGDGSLNDAFDIASIVAGIIGWEPADSCEAGGYEGTWTLGGVEAGRLLCVVQGGTAAITWSHSATGILSTIRQTDGDPEAAWQLWLAAGPE